MVVKLMPHQLRSIIFLTIHGVDFVLPHEYYKIEKSWWDTQHARVEYFLVQTKNGLLVKMFHLDSISYTSPKFIERSLLFTKGEVNGKMVPEKPKLKDWIKNQVPDLRATRWSEYHDSYRDFDVTRLFFVDPWSTMEEKVNYCFEAVSEIP